MLAQNILQIDICIDQLAEINWEARLRRIAAPLFSLCLCLSPSLSFRLSLSLSLSFSLSLSLSLPLFSSPFLSSPHLSSPLPSFHLTSHTSLPDHCSWLLLLTPLLVPLLRLSQLPSPSLFSWFLSPVSALAPPLSLISVPLHLSLLPSHLSLSNFYRLNPLSLSPLPPTPSPARE